MTVNRILLNMIVKNESANIERCLRSLLPVIDGAAIVDTGSTDDTEAIMQRLCAEAGKPLHLDHAPFENFEQARNAALRFARRLVSDYDYILFCDADMELVVRQPAPALTAPSYAILQDNGKVQYWNVRMLHRDQTCEYVGVTHECITPPDLPQALTCWTYKDHESGSSRVDKYVRDVRLLSDALRNDPTNPRLVFYMIQSLFGAGMIERAREFAEFRIRMTEGHPEEKYWALVHRAQFADMLKMAGATVQEEFLQAYNFRPTRAEPLVALARFHRDANEPRIGLLYAREAAIMPRPVMEVLPVESYIYEWGALDEWFMCAIASGNFIEARAAARRLRKRKLPDEQRERIMRNCDNVLVRNDR